jgi:hypothetical protein
MPVLKTHGHWKAGIYQVLYSVAALLLMLIKYKGYNCTGFFKTYHKYRDPVHFGLWHALEN